jgi:glutaconate CoA-transferase subunit A
MLGVEFDTAEHAEEVQWAASRPVCLVLECGRSSVRMSPALTVSEAEMETALRIFGEAVAAVADRGRRSSPRSPRRAPARRSNRPAERGCHRSLARRHDRLVSSSKVVSMRDAIADLVRDGDTVAIEGFTHPHQLRRRSRDHPPAQARADARAADARPRLRPDDRRRGRAQSSSSRGSAIPGVGGLGAIRRRIEGEIPAEPLEIEEYSHFGMVGRYTAGAMNLPFFPLRSYFETDLPVANPLIRPIKSPYGEETIFAVPPLRPDVAIVHAQRASAGGDTQVWGLLGCQKEAAFAAERVIVVVEEVVDEAVIRADPNRTIIPGLIVDAVVVEPWGAHPSYVQGAYDRDNRFYLDWDAITRDEAALQAWLGEWVYDLDGRASYVEKLGSERVESLRPGSARPARSTTGRTADGDRSLPRHRRRPVCRVLCRSARLRDGRADGAQRSLA